MTALSTRSERVTVWAPASGYSSLAYLRQMPVDTLKIDRSFVNGLGASEEEQSIIRIISLGKALHLTILAEGVETAGQDLVLTELGCDVGQGFLWSRPLSFADAEMWIRMHQAVPSRCELVGIRCILDSYPRVGSCIPDSRVPVSARWDRILRSRCHSESVNV